MGSIQHLEISIDDSALEVTNAKMNSWLSYCISDKGIARTVVS